MTGTISLNTSAELFTFTYSTTDPSNSNWIGVYSASGGGPVDEEFVSPSLVWSYTPGSEGTVLVPAGNLQPGQYQAFFLSRDGYKWIAPPIDVAIPEGTATIHFPVETAILHNARQGQPYTARLGGLLLGAGSSTVKFTKASGDEWVSVSSDGALSGTPDQGAYEARVTVAAVADDGSEARLGVTIPVRTARARLVGELGVLSYNLWYGGTQVTNYHEKQLRFILNSNVDVIGLQETTSDHATRLGNALGWYSWQSKKSVGVISRYPIAEEYGEVSNSGGVRIALDGARQQINLWVVHLGSNPYGPYDFCFDGMTVEQVMQREASSGRTPQITATLAAMESHLAASERVPVLLVGDFNAPSHLDWIEALREKNCGYANVSWPTSVKPAAAGLVDSFRVANPDPVSEPALTWSPINPFQDGSTGRVEPQDRIDYIYHAGNLTVLESREVYAGHPSPRPYHQNNEWTSDHGAILTRYKLPRPAGCRAPVTPEL